MELNKKIKELKEFLNLPQQEIIFYKSDGNIHGQIVYNTYSILKDIVEILEYFDKKFNKELNG